ncbi:MAG: hypothetical protein IT256_08110 [Chitinophagaceae bacterium]|nr:hypothetical protein [Chitinophagaceae bacterium]
MDTDKIEIELEEPFKGNAIFEQFDNGIQITIPSNKDWGKSIFLGFWIIVWALGLFFTISILIAGPILLKFIIFVWLIFWVIGGLLAFKGFLWGVFGKEILFVQSGLIEITIDVPFFGNKKTYDLEVSKKFRVKEDDYRFYGIFANRKNDFGKVIPEGRIRFDYGMKTIKFAGGIDEAEATFILSFLKEKNYLQEKNFEN